MIRREPEKDIGIALRAAPPPGAPHEDQMNWLMECGCELGKMVSHFAREVDATDSQLTLIFAYMFGRALGCYVAPNDERGQHACNAMFDLGINHGHRALVGDDLDERATVQGPETKQ